MNVEEEVVVARLHERTGLLPLLFPTLDAGLSQNRRLTLTEGLLSSLPQVPVFLVGRFW